MIRLYKVIGGYLRALEKRLNSFYGWFFTNGNKKRYE